MCPHGDCGAVAHLQCLAARFLGDGEAVVPVEGRCPGCGGTVRWVDVVREATVRVRGGEGEVEGLERREERRVKRLMAGKGKGGEAVGGETDEEGEMDELVLLDAEEDDEVAIAPSSPVPPTKLRKPRKGKEKEKEKAERVIPDSDADSWASALELD